MSFDTMPFNRKLVIVSGIIFIGLLSLVIIFKDNIRSLFESFPAYLIQGSNVEQSYNTQKQIGIVKFDTSIPKIQLIASYEKKLKQHSWQIHEKKQMANKQFLITATQPDQHINLSITIIEQQAENKVILIYSYQ